MAQFTRAASRSQLWDGEMTSVNVGRKRVLLVNLKGELHAYEDRCVHQWVPLSTGKLSNGTITCAAHGWQYDAATGCGINPEGVQLVRCDLRCEGDDVLVDVSDVSSAVGVGPVLTAGKEARAVVAAIQAANPSATVVDRGVYFRITAPQMCRVTREAIAHELGREFRLPSDLERIMVSFAGKLTVDEDEARWEAL